MKCIVSHFVAVGQGLYKVDHIPPRPCLCSGIDRPAVHDGGWLFGASQGFPERRAFITGVSLRYLVSKSSVGRHVCCIGHKNEKKKL